MSNTEKNLTPNERELLKGLNTKANLILEFEAILQKAKMPFNPDYMYGMSEDDLRTCIANFSPEGQARLKNNMNFETKSGK